MDQSSVVAYPARGQLNRENIFSPCSLSRLRVLSSETSSAVPSRVSLPVPHTLAELGSRQPPW